MRYFELAIFIVAIVMVASILKARYRRRNDAPSRDEQLETLRLRDEVRQLKERIQVLERIATDGNSTLERQIEELRDRRAP